MNSDSETHLLLAFAFVEAVLLYAICRHVNRLSQSVRSELTPYLELHMHEDDTEGQS
jgi:hypothetical protein